jgi:hypothetical protein
MRTCPPCPAADTRAARSAVERVRLEVHERCLARIREKLGEPAPEEEVA